MKKLAVALFVIFSLTQGAVLAGQQAGSDPRVYFLLFRTPQGQVVIDDQMIRSMSPDELLRLAALITLSRSLYYGSELTRQYMDTLDLGQRLLPRFFKETRKENVRP